MKFLFYAFMVLYGSTLFGDRYPLTTEPIDVVIPFYKKDLATLELCIKGIKRSCKQIRRVIVISSKRYTDNAEWISESIFPFNKSAVALQLNDNDQKRAHEYLKHPKCRARWYYQQLLKLYAPFVIEGLSSNVLMLDSDTIFLRKVNFIDKSGNGQYNVGYELFDNYFRHMESFTGGAVKRVFPNYSGICHHMLFQKSVLKALFTLVEEHHKKPLWQAFCSSVAKEDLYLAGASEYEIYFNFLFSTTKQAKVRPLKWKNSTRLSNRKKYKQEGYHYVSFHTWNRKD